MAVVCSFIVALSVSAACTPEEMSTAPRGVLGVGGDGEAVLAGGRLGRVLSEGVGVVEELGKSVLRFRFSSCLRAGVWSPYGCQGLWPWNELSGRTESP